MMFCLGGGSGYVPAIWIELLIAGVVSLGVIVVVRAIVTGLSIARRPRPTIKHFR